MLWMWQALLLMFHLLFAETVPNTDEEEEEETTEEEDDDEEEDDEDIKDPKARIRALEEEKSRHAKKAKRAERERDDLARKIKEYEDAEKSEAEKQSDELKQLHTDLSAATDQLDRAEKRIMLLEHDEVAAVPGKRRDYVIKMLVDDIEVDEDGENNIDDLIAGLKKSDPFLFGKTTKDEGGEEEEELPPPPKTGTGRRRRESDAAASRRAMSERFPALQKRAPGVPK